MKVLLDECVPRKLRRELPEHEVLTVTERGWLGIKNGKLLALAEVEVDVFLTVDQNLKYQQNLKAFDIGIILLMARNNRLKTLLPLMPEVREALENIKAGDFIHLDGGQQLIQPDRPIASLSSSLLALPLECFSRAAG
jgi:predicted nuclease of predicted toxin-antitoxin system